MIHPPGGLRLDWVCALHALFGMLRSDCLFPIAERDGGGIGAADLHGDANANANQNTLQKALFGASPHVGALRFCRGSDYRNVSDGHIRS